VPLGPQGEACAALDLLPTLKCLSALLFRGATVTDFIEGMRAGANVDPSEQLLCQAVHDGEAFIPTLLAPEAAETSSNGTSPRSPSSSPPSHGLSMRKILSEPFLADDRLAAMGIDVESMDEFRRGYLAFRAGHPTGAAGEAIRAASAA